MLNEKSNNSEKILLTKTDTTVLGKTQTGIYFPIQIFTDHNSCWIRVSANLQKEIPKDTTVSIKLPVKPVGGVPSRQYQYDSTTGFTLAISADGMLTITPFGAAMPAGKGVMFSEFFFLHN